MVFLTSWFFTFLLISVGLYFLIPKVLRKYWLLGTSLVFHGHFAGPAGMAPIVALGVTVYAAALAIEKWKISSPAWLVGSVCVLALLYYKYTEFLLGLFGVQTTFHPIAPLAISFFTFEFVHYLIEVRKGGPAIKNPVDFWLFAIFFPTIASGPIKRYRDFQTQLVGLSTKLISGEEIHTGLFRIAAGLFKKLIIAEWAMENIHKIEPWIQDPALPAHQLWALMGYQSIRIYMDFAGYSDIAIGIALLLGLRVPENFNWPYLAQSPSDFWSRWHISLSSWIRDYIYIPLGGGHVPTHRKMINGLTAMVLSGIWHGAALHFAAWGIYHGLGLIVQNPIAQIFSGLKKFPKFYRCFSTASTFLFVAVGWLIFFYEWSDLKWILSRMIGLN